MSTDFKEKGAEFVKSVKETDFKEKGTEFVKSVKENETINNTIHKVGESYDSLRKKQESGKHIVEFFTAMLIMAVIGIVIPHLAVLTYLAIGFTIYIFVSRNKFINLEGNVAQRKSDMDENTNAYNKGFGESIKYNQKITEYAPNAINFVDRTTEQFTISQRDAIAYKEAYNDAVTSYNYYVKAFPSCIAAYVWGFSTKTLLKLDTNRDTTITKEAPDIDYNDVL